MMLTIRSERKKKQQKKTISLCKCFECADNVMKRINTDSERVQLKVRDKKWSGSGGKKSIYLLTNRQDRLHGISFFNIRGQYCDSVSSCTKQLCVYWEPLEASQQDSSWLQLSECLLYIGQPTLSLTCWTLTHLLCYSAGKLIPSHIHSY